MSILLAISAVHITFIFLILVYSFAFHRFLLRGALLSSHESRRIGRNLTIKVYPFWVYWYKMIKYVCAAFGSGFIISMFHLATLFCYLQSSSDYALLHNKFNHKNKFLQLIPDSLQFGEVRCNIRNSLTHIVECSLKFKQLCSISLTIPLFKFIPKIRCILRVYRTSRLFLYWENLVSK